MKAQKRTRACEVCHGLKIKCEMPGAEGAWTACTRCQRLSLRCVPAPARLQRDRIAELENQVEVLTAALREMESSASLSVSTESHASLTPDSSLFTNTDDGTGKGILDFIDSLVSIEDQRRALDAYSHGFKSVWCPANLSTQTLEDVRRNSPLLLLTIVAFPMAAETCRKSTSTANQLVKGAISLLARCVLIEGGQNQETVRALLTAAFWHRVPRGEVASHCHQYSRLAIDMAIDIGLGGPEFPGSPAVFFRRMDGHQDNDSGRTWLACYAAAAMYGLNVRRPATVVWSKQHEASLQMLERERRLEDRLFSHIVVLIHLCQLVTEELETCDFTAFHDINSPSCQQIMSNLMGQFEKWKLSVPPDLLGHPMLRFWSNIFAVYLYEIVLHTPTNKPNFAAPHVAANLPVSDFAAPPIVTPAAAAAMGRLISACHGAILSCEDLGPAEILAAPSMIFAPAVMYALKTLVTVFITINGPGSTFGASELIQKDDVCMRQYITKVFDLSKEIEAITYIDTYWTGRILGAASWLETWANDYEVILQRYAENQ
ncbi:hypothetical protein LIA77_07664 [Sarocladium implicatum]|nr:hypothetical protein LIA77_07664 [Sarocladium implicatum]